MNFLAHLYLTKDQPELVGVGNFIADAVKGKNGIKKYPEPLQLGIKIHREIDEFTDRHEIVKQGTHRLHKYYGKFAPIIVDIYYDHILASNWKTYSNLSLRDFSKYQYVLMESHYQFLPDRTRLWYGYMKGHDLLFSYAKEETIDFVLKGMDHRTKNISGMSTAINELREYKEEYTLEFKSFFEEIQKHLELKFNLDIIRS